MAAPVIEIHCQSKGCDAWFPSPIMFGSAETFDVSMLYGNLVQCPKCGRMTGCDKENMRMRHDGGGFVGDRT